MTALYCLFLCSTCLQSLLLLLAHAASSLSPLWPLLVAASSAAATVGPATLGPDAEQSARRTAYIMEGKNADSFLVTKAAPQCNKAIEKYNGTHDG